MSYGIKVVSLLISCTHIRASDNNFCGSSWADASSSCEERQHCPSGSDEECTISPGQICYADTLCDASKGHGVQAAAASLVHIIDIPHDDTKNTMFCGTWWATAQESCGRDTFCGHDRNSCKDFTACYETACNFQDLVAAELGADWKVILSEKLDEDGKPARLDEKDARRNNFCGTSWTHASTKCSKWCMGEDSDCPGNLKCFAETSCYYDEDLVPTLSPTVSPPTTEAPISSDDPINNQFCGVNWSGAIENCSPETNCKDDGDCPESQICYGYLPSCNLNEMSPGIQQEGDNEAQLHLIQDDPTNNLFCGKTWRDAVENCSMKTHCPDNECPKGSTCYPYLDLEGCDAYEFWIKSTTESSQPTTALTNVTDDQTYLPVEFPLVTPTIAPSQIIYGLCARDSDHLQEMYRTAQECSSIEPCPDGLTCIDNIEFESVSKKTTKVPTLKPNTRPTKRPTPLPTRSPEQKLFTLSPEYSEKQLQGEQVTQTNDESAVALDEQLETDKLPPENVYTESGLSDVLTFYCAASISELESSCEFAIECTASVVCPKGQGCIHYDCKTDNNTSQANNLPDLTNFIPECPVDFIGFTSSSDVNCKLYYECKAGEIGEANICDDGLKFDSRRQTCWYENEVNSDCLGPPVGTSEPTFEPSFRPTFDTSILFCPENYVGFTSSNAFDCKLYYHCNNGVPGEIATCGQELKYDIVRQMCWYIEEVNYYCYGPPMGESKHESESWDHPTNGNETYINEIYECLGGFTGWAVHDECKQYYWCNNGTMERDILHCADNLLFDVKHGICKLSSEVQCNKTFGIEHNETLTSSESAKYAWPEPSNADVATDEGYLDEWYSRTQVFLDTSSVSKQKTISLLPFIIILHELVM